MLDQVGVGRSIRLFLADGSPHGLVVAEIGNWSGKVLAASRSRVPDLLRRSEVGRTGVYVLLGADPDRHGRAARKGSGCTSMLMYSMMPSCPRWTIAWEAEG